MNSAVNTPLLVSISFKLPYNGAKCKNKPFVRKTLKKKISSAVGQVEKRMS